MYVFISNLIYKYTYIHLHAYINVIVKIYTTTIGADEIASLCKQCDWG